MMMTGMLCFCVTHNSQAQNTVKQDIGAKCVKAEECKSNVCTNGTCTEAERGTKAGVAVVDAAGVQAQREIDAEEMEYAKDVQACRDGGGTECEK